MVREENLSNRSLDETNTLSVLNDEVELLDKHSLNLPLSKVSEPGTFASSQNPGSGRSIPARWRNSSVSTVDTDEINRIQIKLKGLSYVDSSRSFTPLDGSSPSEESKGFDEDSYLEGHSPPQSIQSEPYGFSKLSTDCSELSLHAEIIRSSKRDGSKRELKSKLCNESSHYIITKFVQAVGHLGSIIVNADNPCHLPLGWIVLSATPDASSSDGELETQAAQKPVLRKATAWEMFQKQRGPQYTIQAMKAFPESADCQTKGCEVLYYYLTWLQLRFMEADSGSDGEALGTQSPLDSRSRESSLTWSPNRRRRPREESYSTSPSPQKDPTNASKGSSNANSKQPPAGAGRPPCLEIPQHTAKIKRAGTGETGVLSPLIVRSSRNSVDLGPSGLVHVPASLERSRQGSSSSEANSGLQTPAHLDHFPVRCDLAPITDDMQAKKRHFLHRAETPPSPNNKGLSGGWKKVPILGKPICEGGGDAEARGAQAARTEEAGQLAALVRYGAMPTLVRALAHHQAFATLLSCLKAISRISSLSQDAAMGLFDMVHQRKSADVSTSQYLSSNRRFSGVSVLLGVLRSSPKKYQLISHAAKALLSAALSGRESASTTISQTNPYRHKPSGGGGSDRRGGGAANYYPSRRSSRDAFFAGVATLITLLESLEAEDDPLSGIVSPRTGVKAHGTLTLLARQRKRRVEAQKAVCKLTFRLLSDSVPAAQAASRIPYAHSLLGGLLLQFGSDPDIEPLAQTMVANTSGAIDFSIGRSALLRASPSPENGKAGGSGSVAGVRRQPELRGRAPPRGGSSMEVRRVTSSGKTCTGHSRSRSKEKSRSRSRGRTPSPLPLRANRFAKENQRGRALSECKGENLGQLFLRSDNMRSNGHGGKMLEAITAPLVRRQGTAGTMEQLLRQKDQEPFQRERSRSVTTAAVSHFNSGNNIK
eukprot:CAMPEP_0117765902 /NCGR_PEP_ID=MMETSP0947-20121206/20459_1 /TAXON_ID=44440 /ORGANISM="Chattonella subsalsa, Strain CCMP2191" /LENGTH=936 /DNA_ID=CAMNT_0005588787 /DNA_START=91 /DNA_END=2901 /DNA_ORIENTATION=+